MIVSGTYLDAIPLAVREAVGKELDHLEQEGIMSKDQAMGFSHCACAHAGETKKCECVVIKK